MIGLFLAYCLRFGLLRLSMPDWRYKPPWRRDALTWAEFQRVMLHMALKAEVDDEARAVMARQAEQNRAPDPEGVPDATLLRAIAKRRKPLGTRPDA